MSKTLSAYLKDLKQEFVAVYARGAGLSLKNPINNRPSYTQKDLEEYSKDITNVIPKVSASGDGATFTVLEAALKNASVAKAKINTKRFEAFVGNRVCKAASALSFYYKPSNTKQSILDNVLSPVVG